MLSTSELLSAAKRCAGIPSNYRLARVMGLSDQTIFRWHSGSGAPDDVHAARLAAMAGLDVEFVVVSMKAAREKDPELRAIWTRVAERLAASPAGPNAVPGGSGHGGTDDEPDFGPSGPSHGGTGLDASADDQTGLCVMSNGGKAETAKSRRLGRIGDRGANGCRVPSSMSKSHDSCPGDLALAFGIDRPFGRLLPCRSSPSGKTSNILAPAHQKSNAVKIDVQTMQQTNKVVR